MTDNFGIKLYAVIVTIIAATMILITIMSGISADALIKVYSDQATEAKAKVDDLQEQLITERGNAMYYYELAEKGIDHEQES